MLGIVAIILQFAVNVGLIYGIYILRKKVDRLEKGANDVEATWEYRLRFVYEIYNPHLFQI